MNPEKSFEENPSSKPEDRSKKPDYKPGFTMSNKRLKEIFTEEELRNLKHVKLSAEHGDVGGADDNAVEELQKSLGRKFNRLEALKWLAEHGKLGAVEAEESLEALPPREVLHKSISQNDVLDDEPARIIEAVVHGKAEGFTSEAIIKLLETYKDIKLVEQEAVVSLLKKYTPEELKEGPDFVKSIGEILINGALPMDKSSLKIRQTIIETLGSSKSSYAVDILARYVEFIRTNEYVVPQGDEINADVYKVHDYIAVINALNNLKKDIEKEEQQERYVELIEILHHQLLDYVQEVERKIEEWKAQNPGLTIASKNTEALEDKDYETNNPIRAEILGWKDNYDRLDDNEKKFIVVNLKQMADEAETAEEILQCMEEDPTSEALRKLYGQFSRTLGENQVESLSHILLNESVIFDPQNSNAKRELMQLIVSVASQDSLEAIKKFSEKVSNYEYAQNEDNLDSPPELLRRRDQELIIWALNELGENMGNVNTIELAKLRDEAQNNYQDVSEEYERWLRNHPKRTA